jgi:hypothetical protein
MLIVPAAEAFSLMRVILPARRPQPARGAAG